jgi:hypothetical protein
MTHPRRLPVFVLLAASIALLIPGIFLPVLTIRGVLTREGIAKAAPMLLERGLSDETVATLQAMINPAVLTLLQLSGSDLRKAIIEQVGPQITAALEQNGAEVQVYSETRSIVSAVRRLYDVGSPVPATLILLFSVVVPLGKAAMVGAAMFVGDAVRRDRMLRFVEAIAKWSMADVFVVAVLIAFLAVQASTTAGEAGPGLVAFQALFGPGFYWFAAYCVFSLASQQLTRRIATPS